MSSYVDCPIADLQRKMHGDEVTTTGVLSCIEDQDSAAGPWATATLTDSTGSVKLNLYDLYEDVFADSRRFVNSGALVRVSGFKQNEDWDSFAVNVQEVTA